MGDWSPYRIFDGALGVTDPVLLSISGGRTSGYLLRQILDAYRGTLPPLVHPVFTNTGREFHETLDFLAEMSSRWSVPITWLERDFDSEAGLPASPATIPSAPRGGSRRSANSAARQRPLLLQPSGRPTRSRTPRSSMGSAGRAVSWPNCRTRPRGSTACARTPSDG